MKRIIFGILIAAFVLSSCGPKLTDEQRFAAYKKKNTNISELMKKYLDNKTGFIEIEEVGEGVEVEKKDPVIKNFEKWGVVERARKLVYGEKVLYLISYDKTERIFLAKEGKFVQIASCEHDEGSGYKYGSMKVGGKSFVGMYWGMMGCNSAYLQYFEFKDDKLIEVTDYLGGHAPDFKFYKVSGEPDPILVLQMRPFDDLKLEPRKEITIYRLENGKYKEAGKWIRGDYSK